MALRSEVVDLLWLESIEKFDEICRVGDIAKVQKKTHAIDMRVLVEPIDPFRVKGRGPTDDAVHLVAFG